MNPINLSKIIKKGPKEVLSIDFGRGFVKIACLQPLGHNFKLISYDIKKITSFADNRDEVLEFINNFIQTHSIKGKGIYVTLSDPDSIIIKRLTLSGVSKEEEILKAAKWQLQEGLSFSIEEAVLDSRKIREFTDEEGVKKIDILFVLAYAQALRQYLLVIKECELIPIIASLGPFNYSYLLKRISPQEEETQALLDIGQYNSTLCIFKGSELTLARTLSFSSEKLAKSLTSSLTSDKGKISFSYEEADRIREEFGIPKDDTVELKKGVNAGQVMSLLRPVFDELIRDFKFTSYYYTSNYQEKAPSKLYITGGGANLKNLGNYLKKELGVEVAQLPLPDCILTEEAQRKDLEKNKNQMMSTLGAVFATFGAVNLLPSEFRSLRREFIEKAALRVFTFGMWAIFLAVLLIVYGQFQGYKNKLKYSHLHLQNIQDIQGLKNQCVFRENLIQKIQRGRVPVDGVLKVISALITHDIILNRLSFNQENDTLIFKGSVSASGEIAALKLTDFMKKIEASSYFKDTQLVSSERFGEVQRFEIKCILVQ
ncbi:MAG: pilus assembly protein PilM [Candidatus Omnitrophota bacterium]|nr:MAG: pilus assembly protein PilM [Candidatus Omnitrophota bacterium]